MLHTSSGPLAFEHREVQSRARHWFEAHFEGGLLVGAEVADVFWGGGRLSLPLRPPGLPRMHPISREPGYC